VLTDVFYSFSIFYASVYFRLGLFWFSGLVCSGLGLFWSGSGLVWFVLLWFVLVWFVLVWVCSGLVCSGLGLFWSGLVPSF
jgi:hypothetical protein